MKELYFLPPPSGVYAEIREALLPQDILRIGAGGINQICRDAKVRAAGTKRSQILIEAVQNSAGLEVGEDLL